MESINIHKLHKKYGVTFIEILIALFILALAILPAVGTFSTYYTSATRQMEQEMALKIAESVVNLMQTISYEQLADGVAFPMQLDIQTSDNTIPCILSLVENSEKEIDYGDGTKAFVLYSVKCDNIQINRIKYNINVDIVKAFEEHDIAVTSNNNINYMSFIYYDNLSESESAEPIKKYNSFDPAFIFNVSVGFGKAKPIKLSAFRADMVK